MLFVDHRPTDRPSRPPMFFLDSEPPMDTIYHNMMVAMPHGMHNMWRAWRAVKKGGGE